jgi:ADP-heptose:LPS heptosyltransferase
MSSTGPKDPERFERILVRICNSKLGDLLMATPTLEGIRRKHPEAKITLLLPLPSPGAWIEQHPLVDSILWEQPRGKTQNLAETLRLLKVLRRSRFDAVIDLRLRARYAWLYWLARIPLRSASCTKYYAFLLTHNIPFDFETPDRHEVEFNYGIAAPLGLDDCPGDTVLPVSLADDTEARHLLTENGIGPEEDYLLLNPTFGGSSRLWPPERFAAAAQGIFRETGVRIVLIGGHVPPDGGCEIRRLLPTSTVDLRGRTSIPTLAALLKRSALHVSVDTGTSHLAAAMHTPCVTIFTFFEYWQQRKRWQPWHTLLRTIGPQTRCASCPSPREICKRTETTCIDSVSTQQVVDAAVELLALAERAVRPMPLESEIQVVQLSPA